jgi:hypothetical protein
VYRSLPRKEQVYTLSKQLKSLAVLAIKEGRGEEEVLKVLQQRVGKQNAPVVKEKREPVVRTVSSFSRGLFSVWAKGRKAGSGAYPTHQGGWIGPFYLPFTVVHICLITSENP